MGANLRIIQYSLPLSFEAEIPLRTQRAPHWSALRCSAVVHHVTRAWSELQIGVAATDSRGNC
jgi:hypothetical protein